MTRSRPPRQATGTASLPLRPSEILPTWRISGRIRDCHRLLNNELQRRFGPFDIKISDWLHLRNIAENDGLTQVELSRQLRMEKASSTVVLHKLQTRGLIAGKRMTSDRRKIGIYLTPKGRKLMEKLIPIVLSVIGRATSGISDEDMEVMARTIDRLMENLESSPVDDAQH